MPNKAYVFVNKLRHLVQFQTKTGTQQDAYGENTPVFQLTAQVRADIQPLSGRELFLAQQVQADVTHKITTRYFLPKPAPTDTMLFQGRTFNLMSIQDIEERHLKFEILAKEIV